MKIAVTYENGNVFQHFGHTEQFKIYEVENDTIIKTEVVDTNGNGHGALAGFLTSLGVDTLICGGIGGGAQNALNAAGIKFYGGVSGSADDAVYALIHNELNYNAEVMCDHHGHHDNGHECRGAEHNCGEDKQGCSGNGCH